MKYSEYLIPTLKEIPKEAESKSHQLMLRSGMIRKLSSGTYSYLPLGLRALKLAEQVVREEMESIGALEVLLPAIHPIDLWKQTGRLEILGDDMIHFKDRHGRWNVLGPTHEEVVTDLAKNEIKSYKQLPIILYQFQTKFRDEMRPRAGVIRSREFIMKDAYSFHLETSSLDEVYEKVRGAYCNIFERCGLDYKIVEADSGAMGGSGSQEFLLFSESGEDYVVEYLNSGKVTSAEMAPIYRMKLSMPKPCADESKEIHTPGVSSIESVSNFLKIKAHKMVKTIIYRKDVDHETSVDNPYVAVLVRGDHEVNEFKVRKIFPKAVLASADDIRGCSSEFGFSGPVGLSKCDLVVDQDVAEMSKIVVGANKKDYHRVGLNPASFLNSAFKIGDYRLIQKGDRSIEGGEAVEVDLKTAIELGHIFKLGIRYSKPLKANVLDENSQETPLIMGCYGIGINRIVAAAIEQGAKDHSMVWPSDEIAPFKVHLISTNVKEDEVASISGEIYNLLKSAGLDVFWDDRDISAGVKFKDADLMGFPYRLVVGPRGLKEGLVEFKKMRSDTSKSVKPDQVIDLVLNEIKSLKS